MEFRPCIDLHDGKVKQIVGSTLDADGRATTNFVADRPPAYYAQLYRADNLSGGHVIMLGPGNEEAARQALAAWPGHLQVGGGITAANAGQWLDVGAQAVIVTSWVFRDGVIDRDRLAQLVRAVGREHLVLDLSCRRRGDDYVIVTDRWQTFTDTVISPATLEELAQYCFEFLVHGVDVEGRCQGIEVELARRLADWSPIPTTYAGGIATMDDLRLLRDMGRDRLHATVGSALDIFGGTTLRYREVVAFCRGGAAVPSRQA